MLRDLEVFLRYVTLIAVRFYLLTLDCLGLVSENFWDVLSRSRLEQKIERLGLGLGLVKFW